MSISTFTGLETALRGLMASQQALDITGENITNASTPGYTRQTVSMQTTARGPRDRQWAYDVPQSGMSVA